MAKKLFLTLALAAVGSVTLAIGGLLLLATRPDLSYLAGIGPVRDTGALALADQLVIVSSVDELVTGSGAPGDVNDAATADGRAIVVRDAAGGVRMSVPYAGRAALAWSPGRDQLAFVSAPRDMPLAFGPLRLVDVAAGRVHTMTDDVVLAFFWAPDGRSIAYVTAADVLAEAPPAGSPGFDEPAPDSVAAGIDLAGPDDHVPLDLWVVAAGPGETPRRLATFTPTTVFRRQFVPAFDQYTESHSLWSPDGRSLVVPALDRAGVPRITIVPADGGAPGTVAEGTLAFWRR